MMGFRIERGKLQEIDKRTCPHDYENYIRKGRGHLVCPKCLEDITLEVVLMQKMRGKAMIDKTYIEMCRTVVEIQDLRHRRYIIIAFMMGILAACIGGIAYFSYM